MRGYNVLLVVMDALRADHLGTYGYFRETSPFIDSLADEGLVFEKATSPSSYTLQSISGVFSGQLPSRLGAVEWAAHPPERTMLLAERFKAVGYITGFVSPEAVLGMAGFKQGVDHVRQDPGLHDPDLNRRLAEHALALARESGSRPFFTYLHFFNPHNPYSPPPQTYLEFAEAVWPDPLSSEAAITRGVGELVLGGFGQGDPQFEDLVTRYDGEIRALDQTIAELFAGLKRIGKLDRTLILITSDHGDEFLEHGYLDHAFTLYEEVTHIPLILWAPRAIKPGRITRRVSSMDIPPTLSSSMDLPEDGPFDGTHLFSTESRPVISELLMEDRSISRSIIMDEWKYIASVRWRNVRDRKPGRVPSWTAALSRNGFGTDYRTPLMKEELYHLASDPREQHNLEGSHPDKLSELRYLLESRLSDSRSVMSTPKDPPEATDVIGSLRALGYLQASSYSRTDGPAFQVPHYEPGSLLDFGTPEADLYLPYGWSEPEGTHRWTDGDEALLWFRLSNPVTMDLELEGSAYGDQAVTVVLNGTRVATLAPRRQIHVIELPKARLGSLNRIQFVTPQATLPQTPPGVVDDRLVGFRAIKAVMREMRP